MAFVDIDEHKIGSTVRQVPVVRAAELPRLWTSRKRPFLLSAVASRGARELIRIELSRQGLIEGEDFLCVA